MSPEYQVSNTRYCRTKAFSDNGSFMLKVTLVSMVNCGEFDLLLEKTTKYQIVKHIT